MDAFIVGFNVMMPIFLLMVTGVVVRKLGMVDEKSVKVMNNVVFRVFLPAMLFVSIYNMDREELLNIRLILFVGGVTCAAFLLAFAAIPAMVKERNRKGVVIQGMIRGNLVYFGIPIVRLLAGDEYVGIAALAIAVVAPLYNIFSVFVLEFFRDGHPRPGKVLGGIATNPMIVSIGVALIFMMLNLPVPGFAMVALTEAGRVASPLALILLGASFNFSSIKGYGKEVGMTVAVKLLLVPAVALPIAYLLDFGKPEMATLLATLGAPTAVASFAMTQQMEGDEVLAGQIVVYSSIGAVFTIFALIVILRNVGVV